MRRFNDMSVRVKTYLAVLLAAVAAVAVGLVGLQKLRPAPGRSPKISPASPKPPA